MNLNDDQTCKACGQLIPADADTFELCPSCLLSQVIELRSQEAMRSGGAEWEIPTVEALDILLDGFKVIEQIGMGGMGVN